MLTFYNIPRLNVETLTATKFCVIETALIIVFPEIALWLPRALMPMTFK